MKRIFVAALALVLVACGSQGAAEDDLTSIIQQREDAWAAAYNAGDAEALGNIYVEDAVLVPPGSDPIWGNQNIADVLSGYFGVLVDLELVTDNVRPMGADYAVEVGHSTYVLVGEDGTRTPGRDNYVNVWHKGEDGVWRYTTDIFNAGAE